MNRFSARIRLTLAAAGLAATLAVYFALYTAFFLGKIFR